jgi:hypothetical protein
MALHSKQVEKDTAKRCIFMVKIIYIYIYIKEIIANFGNRVSQQYTIMNTNKINRI